jgi:hypothetical protein
MVNKNIRAETRNLAGIDFVAEQLGLGIKCCEVALSSASARTWHNQIKAAQKAHDTAQRSASCTGSGFPGTKLGALAIASFT